MSVATIKDVARHAGVSTATVSRVINNSGFVRPDTVQKVLSAIEEIQYVPNITARNLKNDSSSIIAFLISNISNTHFTIMAKTIDSILRNAGYSLMVSSTDDDPKTEIEQLKRMQSLNVQGIILNTTGRNDKLVAELSEKIPMVLVDRSVSSLEFRGDFVGSNGYSGVYDITEHLIDRGHRRIAIISSDLSTSTGRERLAGFSAAMKKIGVTVDDHYIYNFNSGHFNEEGGIRGCKYLMELEEPPTAIVVSNNDMAIGVYKYLARHNYRIPQDVSVASFGNINNSDLFKVQPTFATLNPMFIGEKAANLILSRISNPAVGAREVIFEPLMVIKDSTRSL